MSWPAAGVPIPPSLPEVFGEPARSSHKPHLIKRIAWRTQANREGGLSERALRRAAEVANDADLRLTMPGDRPTDKQQGNNNAPGALDANGLPKNRIAIAEDVIGANADQTQG